VSPGAPLVEVLGHRGAFRSLAPAWESLAQRCGFRGPFLLPTWLAVWATDLARPPGALRLLVAHRRGALAGALPLVAERRRVGGVAVRLLRSLSDDHSQRFDLLAEDDEALAALWASLARDPWWEVLELRDVPDESRLAGRLVELARVQGFPTGAWPSQRSPWLQLPATAEALDASLSAKFRANLRRRARRLGEELGPVTLERITDERAIARALDEGLALEASGWKGERGTAILADARLRRRYHALAHVLARRGELALDFLVAGSRRVAFHYAAESDGVYYLFKPGHDASLARLGLGQLLLYRVAQSLIERGGREIDLLGDDVPWKRSWTGLVRGHSWRYVFRPTVAGRALCAWKLRALPALRRAVDEVARRAHFADATEAPREETT
jgi:CelD/BcsL family acetyltransferase involved in cellulose biosynthesis